jgi:hypothetical protein
MEYTLTKDYTIYRVDFKAGNYSQDEIIDRCGMNFGIFNYLIKCTDLKHVLVPAEEVVEKVESIKEIIVKEEIQVQQEVIKETAVEEVVEKVEILYLVEKEIKRKKNVLFSIGQKITFAEIEEAGLDIDKLVKEGFLIETKTFK